MTAIELLVEALVASYPADAARTLERLQPGEAAALLGELPPERATAVLARMEVAFAASLLEQLAEPAEIVAGLPPADAAVLVRRTPAAFTASLLAACPSEFARAVGAVIVHPARSAGAMMDPHAPSLPRDLTAAAALAEIRARPAPFKHYVYVVDRGGVLIGVTRLLDLIAAAPELPLDELMRAPVARLHADELEVAVLAHPGWALYTSVPVVDRDERLIGVIRDDVVRAIQARARAAQQTRPVSLALSFAELFWFGLTGVTEGVANVVGREAAVAPAPPEPEPEPRR